MLVLLMSQKKINNKKTSQMGKGGMEKDTSRKVGKSLTLPAQSVYEERLIEQ